MLKKNGKILSFTPESLHQMFQLKICDMIAGQIDRHANNVMVTKWAEDDTTWYIQSVKGIDNDMAFGQLKIDELEVGKCILHLGGLWAREYVNVKGKGNKWMYNKEANSITYLKKDFYDRVMNYTPEMAEYHQIDLRSAEEIEALKGRLTDVKTQLRQMVSDGQIVLIDSDKDYEKNMNQAYDDTIKHAQKYKGVFDNASERHFRHDLLAPRKQ